MHDSTACSSKALSALTFGLASEFDAITGSFHCASPLRSHLDSYSTLLRTPCSSLQRSSIGRP